jgi:hypothetical protein
VTQPSNAVALRRVSGSVSSTDVEEAHVGQRARTAADSAVAPLTAVVQLTALVAAAAAVWATLGFGTPAPWVIPDEIIYSELAKSLADSGIPAIRGVTELGYGVLYPLLLSPAWLVFDDVQQAHAAALVINSFLMASSAVPAYLLARHFTQHRGALLVASFSVFVPGMAYTSTLLTENLFYPAFLFALIAITRALERPTKSGQLIALGAIVLVTAAKLVGVVLLPAYLTSICALAVFARRRGATMSSTLAKYRLSLWLAGGAIVLGSATSLAVGRGVTDALGAYAGVVHSVDVVAIPWSFLLQIGALSLSAAVIPLAGTIALFIAVMRGSLSSRTTERFVILAGPVVVWLALTVAVSSEALSAAAVGSSGEARLHERYLFVTAPLLFLGLVLWLQAGAFRRRWFAVVGAVSAASLAALIPVSELRPNANLQAPSLLPWLLFDGLGQVALAFAAALGGLLFVKTSVRRSRLLWIPIGLAFFVASILTSASFRASAAWARDIGTGANPSWIDEQVGSDASVAVLWNDPDQTEFAPGRKSQRVLWVNEFFNRSIDRIYVLGARNPERLPDERVRIASHGVLVRGSGEPVGDRYVLTCGVVLASPVIAHDPDTGAVLFETNGLARVRSVAPSFCRGRAEDEGRSVASPPVGDAE